MQIYDHIIVGAGISGLYLAKLLQQQSQKEKIQSKILVLESNNRLGGRLYSPQGHDMGATWTWPNHDVRVFSLAKELDVTIFETEEYNQNLQLIDISKKKRHEIPQQLRFVGGSQQLATKLASKLSLNENISILLEHQVNSIEKQKNDDTIQVKAATKENKECTSFLAKQSVTLALPPRLISKNISIKPSLSSKKLNAMNNTPTWMDQASKAYLTFDKKYWIDDDLPMHLNGGIMIFDVSNDNTINENKIEVNKHTICLFNGGTPRKLDEKFITYQILPFLSQQFRKKQLKNPTIQIKNWVTDPHVSFTDKVKSSSIMQDAYLFGNRELRVPHENTIYFASTETENEYGHIEGALLSAERVARQIMSESNK